MTQTKNVFQQLFDFKNIDGKELLAILRRFCNSYLFYAFEFVAACLFVAAGKEVEGAVFFVSMIGVLLVLSEDILPTTFPFLLICTFTTNCYDSFNTFIQYIWYAPIAVICLVFHFVYYRQPFSSGKSVYGIMAVSLAILLGGIGLFSAKDYFYGGYYLLGLSLGMLAAYYLMYSQFSAPRDYDLSTRFSVIMTMLGLFCTFMVSSGYFKYYHNIPTYTNGYGFSQNNIATLLMFTLPFPVFLSKKHRWLAVLSVVLFATLAVTRSRGGLIFGTLEFAVTCVYWIYSMKRRLLCSILCVVAVAVVLLIFHKPLYNIINDRFEGGVRGEARWNMAFQAFEKFKQRPILGFGILDKSNEYAGYMKKGSMAWYHMMIPQIIASMGLVGVAAYVFQGIGRIKLIFTRPSLWSLCLGISYLGILGMSQVNPGEFCPLPFELLTVLLFILQELRLKKLGLPLLIKPRKI